MGNCIRGSKYRWPGGRVPYVDDGLPADEKAAIEAAVGIWNDSGAGVRFERYTGPQQPTVPPYVRFVSGDSDTSCRTSVGRRRPAQKIYCQLGTNTLVHEMGHTLGLLHEHQRPDRNNHVAVIEDNIVDQFRFAYDRLGVDEAIAVGPYDYVSVMHYDADAFAVDFRVNVEVPRVATPHPPAMAIFDGALHLVWTDEDKRLFHTSSTDLADFLPPRRISGQSSRTGPALAAFGSRLFLVHLGATSDDVWISESENGRTFEPNQRIPGVRSGLVPAIAAAGGELHLCWRGQSSSQLWHSWSATGAPDDWSEPAPIAGQTSKSRPGLAGLGSSLHLTHLGARSSQIWSSVSVDRRSWSENKATGQTSKAPPAMSAFGSTVHLAHLGQTSSEIWHARKGSTGTRFGSNSKTNQSSASAPVLASGLLGGGETVLAHRGRVSDRVYISRYDPDLVAMVAVATSPTGGIGGDQLSDGDLAAVRFMYG